MIMGKYWNKKKYGVMDFVYDPGRLNTPKHPQNVVFWTFWSFVKEIANIWLFE